MSDRTHLDALYENARAALPGVELERTSFRTAAAGVPELSAERALELYLSRACASGDRTALAAFEARYLGGLTSALRRFGADSFVDDAMQELRQRLFLGVEGGPPKLLEYGGRGELKQWLRAVATRVALNLRKSRHDERFTDLGDEGLFELPLAEDDPELRHMKSMYRSEFKKAFSEALQALPAEARNHLRLYYIDGLGVVELGKLFGTSAPTVSRRLAAARTALFDGTRQRLGERLDVSAEELESIMRLIESRLSVDVKTLAQTP